MEGSWGRSSEPQSRELVSLPKFEPATYRIRSMTANHSVALFGAIVWYAENVLSVKTTFLSFVTIFRTQNNVLSLNTMFFYSIQFHVSQDNFLSLNSRQYAVTQNSALSFKTIFCQLNTIFCRLTQDIVLLCFYSIQLSRVMKHYFPTGRRNHGRPLKRLLDTWDRNGQQVAQLHDVYDDDDDDSIQCSVPQHSAVSLKTIFCHLKQCSFLINRVLCLSRQFSVA